MKGFPICSRRSRNSGNRGVQSVGAFTQTLDDELGAGAQLRGGLKFGGGHGPHIGFLPVFRQHALEFAGLQRMSDVPSSKKDNAVTRQRPIAHDVTVI